MFLVRLKNVYCWLDFDQKRTILKKERKGTITTKIWLTFDGQSKKIIIFQLFESIELQLNAAI